MAECEVAKEALVLRVKLGIRRVHLEGDSKIIINGIKKGKLESCHINKHISKIKGMLKEFEDFKISHVNRDANEVVDKLANLGANVPFGNQNDIFEDFRLLKFDQG